MTDPPPIALRDALFIKQVHPVGTCLQGKDCPYRHSKTAKKGVDSAAAPSGEPTKKGKPQVCRLFLETGKCRFGDSCSYVHESPNKRNSDKNSDAKKGDKPDAKKSAGKKEDPRKKKKGRPGAMAEIAEQSDGPSAEDSDNELSSYSEDQD
eukprot:13185065-Heterocapsa_arctica.AAC.1